MEVKSKPVLGARDLRQLGRNMQAVGQGGASGVIYKLPAGAQGATATGQVRAASEMMGVPVTIVRI